MEEAGQLDGFDLGRSHEAGTVEMFGGDVVATSSNSGANVAGPRGQRPRERPCLGVCGRETSHPVQAREGG